jgi:hypothetical protein
MTQSLSILVTRALTDAQRERLHALAPQARLPRLPAGMWRAARGLQWLQSDMAGGEPLRNVVDRARGD